MRTSLGFGGLAGFGDTLRRDLVAHVLKSADFHPQLGNMC